MADGKVGVLYFIPVIAVAVIFGAVFLPPLFQDQQARDQLPSVLEGKPAPDVDVVQLAGKRNIDNKDLRGEGVKLVNFWASWCGPCRVEHPNLEELASEGVPIYGVNYKDKPANALRFLDELGDPFVAIGADEKGRNALEWGVYGVPETFVVDGEGNIVLRFAGPITDRVLEGQIRPAMEKAAR